MAMALSLICALRGRCSFSCLPQDTGATLGLLAKLCGTKPKTFGIAGTKDKRGCTTQFCTAFKIPRQRLAQVNTRRQGIAVGSFSYVAQELKLGDLQGNQFQLVLRDVKVPTADAEVDAAAAAAPAEVEAVGTDAAATAAASLEACRAYAAGVMQEWATHQYRFLNYFGLQRFGTTEVPTHHIGRALLAEKWDEAVDLIIGAKPTEDFEVSSAKALYFEHKDAKAAARALPRWMGLEKSVFQAIDKHGAHQPLQAIMAVPHRTRLLYLHAYQSYLWNAMVNARLEKLGWEPVVGDLVLDKAAAAAEAAAAEAGEDEDDGTTDVGSDSLHPVRTLTAEDITAKTFRIEDVVLPLPGFAVQYPSHEVGQEWVCTTLGEDLAAAEVNLLARSRHKWMSLRGGYRTMVAAAEGMAWDVVSYQNTEVSIADRVPCPSVLPPSFTYMHFTLAHRQHAMVLARYIALAPSRSKLGPGLDHL